MFHFGGFPTYTYGFSVRSMVLHHGSSLIRKSTDRSLFAAPRGLSQLVTSFFGSWCQGIHLMLLFAWTSFWTFLFFAVLSFTWIAWVSKHGYYFAAKRFHPFCTFFSVLRQNCVLYPLIGKTWSFALNCLSARFVFVLSICFSYSIFSLYSIFNEHWIREYVLGIEPRTRQAEFTKNVSRPWRPRLTSEAAILSSSFSQLCIFTIFQA